MVSFNNFHFLSPQRRNYHNPRFNISFHGIIYILDLWDTYIFVTFDCSLLPFAALSLKFSGMLVFEPHPFVAPWTVDFRDMTLCHFNLRSLKHLTAELSLSLILGSLGHDSAPLHSKISKAFDSSFSLSLILGYLGHDSVPLHSKISESFNSRVFPFYNFKIFGTRLL